MMRSILFLFVFSLVLTLLGGCATHSDFTAISGKNVNISNMKIDKSQSKGTTSGEDCSHIISFIPVGSLNPTVDEAVDRALEAKRADILLDASLDFHTFYIPLIYGQTCWKVEGTAYETYK